MNVRIDGQQFEDLTNADDEFSLAHDAGYDAFMTGNVYFYILNTLEVNRTSFKKLFKNKMPQGNIKYPMIIDDTNYPYKNKKLDLYHVYPFDQSYNLEFNKVQKWIETQYGAILKISRGLSNEMLFKFQDLRV